MNKILLIACFLPKLLMQHILASDSHELIKIRIHSPFEDLYLGEQDNWLVRIENHGNVDIPIPLEISHPDDSSYFPPAQFHIQTWDDVLNDSQPNPSSWAEIMKFATGVMNSEDGLEDTESALLKPGMALESPSIYRLSGLRTPLGDGRFRVAMQVSDERFIYSNWITRRRIGEYPAGMRTLLESEPWGQGTQAVIQISEETNPRYLWFSTKGTPNIIMNRISVVPDDVEPIVELDKKRRQFKISFDSTLNTDLFFGHQIGVTKRTPFPENHTGGEFLITHHPVDSDSPIGFPVELFENSTNGNEIHPPDDEPLHQSKNIIHEHPDSGEHTKYKFWLILILFVFTTVSYITYRIINQK